MLTMITAGIYQVLYWVLEASRECFHFVYTESQGVRHFFFFYFICIL